MSIPAIWSYSLLPRFLTGITLTTESDVIHAIDKLHVDYGVKNVVITSFDIEGQETDNDYIVVLGSQFLKGTSCCFKQLLTEKPESKVANRFKIKVKKINTYFTGTGDLFAALLLGYLIKQTKSSPVPSSLGKATLKAVSVLQAILHSPHNKNRRVGNNKFQEVNIVPCGDIIRESHVSNSELGIIFESWDSEVVYPRLP